jgi:hypothetical protein
MEVVVREYVGTLLNEKSIGEILEKVKEASADLRQKLVEVPSEDKACIDKMAGLGFERVSLTTLSGNLDDRLWNDLCAAPLRVAGERPSQERRSDDTSASVVTSADVNRICNSWPEPPWQEVAELFRLFEQSSSGSGDRNEPPIRLWPRKLRGLDERVRKRLNTMGLQYIHLTKMVQNGATRSGVPRTVAIENVQRLKATRNRKSDNSTGGQEVWTIKALSRALPSGSSAGKEEYLETAKKHAERAVQGCGNETCDAGSS